MKQEATAIVVGAGPAGLAAAACLNCAGIPNLVLEREDRFAPLWSKYGYDRLHLHLTKQTCELPLMPFPESYPTYPSKDQFVEYLSEYVAHFGIAPLYHRSVKSASFDAATERWKVTAKNSATGQEEEFSAKFLVVASGETADPFIPEIEGLTSFPGKILHSTRYKSGKEFTDKSVLVVGSGNSGMEIALDLANHGARTSIVVRSPILWQMNICSREMMHWATVLVRYLRPDWVETMMVKLSRLWYGDLTRYGIKRPEEGPFKMHAKYGKFPIIDVGTCKKIKSGEIQVLPGITRVRGNEVLFENGKTYPFDAIILATGFKRSTKKWLKGDDDLFDDDGFARQRPPNNWKGKNGLYCVGFTRRGFSGIRIDAQKVADDVKALLN